MRRALLTSLIASSISAFAVAPALATSARLTPAGGAQFPKRAYVLTLPAGATTGGGPVRIYENGQPVTGLRVRSASDRFAVMLLIDASTSMRGAPIRSAMAAARAFAAQRPSGQSLGITTFNDSPHVLVRPTTDASAIARALVARPKLRQGTHIFDALNAGLGQVTGKKFDAAAVVLLSDGHDYGSATTFERMLATARRAHAKLFTVGVRSSYFDPSTLVDIASRGSGEYLGAATPKKLTALYQRLGSELSAAYSIRYLSSAPAESHIRVSAELGAERADLSYTTPSLHVPGAARRERPRPSDDQPLLGSSAGAAIVAAIVFALAFMGFLVFLAQRRRGAIRRRLSYYGTTSVASALSPAADDHVPHTRERADWLVRLETNLELGRLDRSPQRYLTECAGIALGVALFAAGVIGSGLVAFLAVVAGGPAIAWLRLRRAIGKQRKLFGEQLADNIETVASALRTGHSFAGALAQMVETAPEPTAREFRRVIADERLGVPLDVALGRIVDRMCSKHLRQVSLVTVIQRETGGNGAEALDRVVENIRAGDDLRRLVRTLTSQGRLAQGVLTALPVVTALAFALLGGDAMDPLFETGLGHAALAVAAAMVAAGGIWIGRIVKVRV